MYKFIVGLLVVAGLSALGASLYFYSGDDGEGLNIETILPDKILIGVPFSMRVGVANNGAAILNDTKITLALPEGVAFVGKSANKNIETKSLGKVGIGSVTQEEFKLVATSGDQSIKQIAATVSYLPEGVSSRFEKKKDVDIALTGLGLNLDVRSPERALGGEDFTFEIYYKNISDIDYENLQLRLEYSPSFEFKKASLAPDVGKNLWKLGGLRKGSEMKFEITGNLAGAPESRHDIRAIVQAEFSGEFYSIAEKSATVELTPSPLTLSLKANNNPDYIASPGDELSYLITYTNSADQGFRDAIIKVDLKSEMFDFGTVRSSGIVGVQGASIVWNTATNPELVVVPPQASGAVSFTIKTRGTYPIRRLSDKNFVLKADVRIESPTVLPSVQSKTTIGIVRLETKVRGDAKIDTRLLFRDADSGIINRGPIPPRVGQATNYTVHWVIRNYGTDISGVVVSANLAPGVRYAGIYKSSAPGNFSYSEGSGMVGWSFDKISATKGVIDKPYEIVFQIEATPGQNYLKDFMPLISETIMTAKDEFTGYDIRSRDEALTTAAPDDSTVGAQGGIVMP